MLNNLSKKIAFILGIAGSVMNFVGLLIGLLTNLELLGTSYYVTINLPIAISLLINIVLFLVLIQKFKKYDLYLFLAIVFNGCILFPTILYYVGFLFYHYYYILAIFAGFSNIKRFRKIFVIGIIILADFIWLSTVENGVDVQLGVLNEFQFKYVIPPTIMFIITYLVVDYLYQLFLKEHQTVLDREAFIENESMKDGLTRAYTRQLFDQDLQKKDIKAVIMIDVDFFKKVNDNFGHQVGDQILKDLVHILYPMRSYSFQVYRYGGEEFCILSTLDYESTYKYVDAFMDLVRTTLRAENSPVTISIGISTNTKLTKLDMVKDADDNLYKAKQNGRDRCYINGRPAFVR